MFSGTYKENDVIFLLKKINIKSTDIKEKEKNIKNGIAHYSEMITFEKAPTKEYLDIYYSNLKLNGSRFKQDLLKLTEKIYSEHKEEIVIVSLVRAGTPIGVLLKRFLLSEYNKDSTHYSVSIIRDRGIDTNALKHILLTHKDKHIVFVDGWTGKGVITDELKYSIDIFNKTNNTKINSNLYVVTDISGKAYWAASHEDYLIPSAIFNSTISGLISRSILNTLYINPDDFHGCIYYENLKEYDISQEFINYIFNLKVDKFLPKIEQNIFELNKISNDLVADIINKYSLSNRNYVKPGIGETTRVLLRRLPKEILIKNMNDINVLHILHLAKEKGIVIRNEPALAYNAVAIIEEND